MKEKKYSHVKAGKIPRIYRLSFFTESMLISRGKKDAKRNVIRLDDNGSYYSPFIKKEISLCLIAFENEKIDLLNRVTGNTVNRHSYESKILQNNYTISTIKDNNDYYSTRKTNSSLIYSDNESLNNLIDYHEKMSDYFAQNSRLNSIECSKIDLSNSIIANRIISKKEYDLTYIRCSQLYELLLARLSAYWTGVLRYDSKKMIMPPHFPYKNLLAELSNQLDELKFNKGVE